MAQKEKLFILEDEEINIQTYENVFPSFDLKICSNIEDSIKFIHSSEFNEISLAILDINLGEGLKIGGFNIAYQIVKAAPDMPLIICTAYKSYPEVEKYSRLIGAVLVEKPIKNELVDIINEIIKEAKFGEITELEKFVREFMSGSYYLKRIIEKDALISTDFFDEVGKLEDAEKSILHYFDKILARKTGKAEPYTTVNKLGDKRLFKSIIEYFVPNMMKTLKELLFSLNEDDQTSDLHSGDDLIILNELSLLGDNIIEKTAYL